MHSVIRDVDYDPATFIHLKENIAYLLGGHKGGTGRREAGPPQVGKLVFVSVDTAETSKMGRLPKVT